MERQQFKKFCEKEFELQGFKKKKNMFYLKGVDLLCRINLQKSNYGNVYYVNYQYFIGDFDDSINYSSLEECDVEGRIIVLSKKETFQGKSFMTPQIEYEEYTEEELRKFFENEFKEKILPPIKQGKKYILSKLDQIYFLTLNQETVRKKLET